MVCHGRGCNVTFKACTFQHSSLVVLGGAVVNLIDCKFIQQNSQKCFNSIPSRSNVAGGRNKSRGPHNSVFVPTEEPLKEDQCLGISVFAMGGGTAVCMQTCHMSGGIQGVAVHRGARLDAKQLVVSEVSATGIEVKDEGSQAVLQACRFNACHSQQPAVAGSSTSTSGTDTCASVSTGASAPVTAPADSARALLIHSGAFAEVTGATARNCERGFVVADTGRLNASTIVMSHLCDAAVEVRDAGSHMALSNCKINDCHASEHASQGGAARGLFVHCNSSAEVAQLNMSDSDLGVVVATGANANIRDSEVMHVTQACISFRSGATGSVSASNMSGSKLAHGLVVSGEGSCAAARNCYFTKNSECGAVSFEGGALDLDSCASEKNTGCAFWAVQNATLTGRDCSSHQDERGIGGQGWCTIVMHRCAVKECAHECYTIKQGSTGTFKSCTGTGGGGVGARVGGQGTSASFSGCEIMHCKHHGMVVSREASVSLEHCLVSDVGRAEGGLYAADGIKVMEGCRATFEDSKFLRCAAVGVRCTGSSCEVACIRCSTADCREAGFAVEGNARLLLNKCDSASDGCGCKVGALGELEASKSTFRSSLGSGVFIQGTAKLTECAITGSVSTGVQVSHQQSVCTGAEGGEGKYTVVMTGCVVSKTAGSSVSFSKESLPGKVESWKAGQLENCTFSESKAHGVEVSGQGSSVVAKECKLMHNKMCGVTVMHGGHAQLVGCATRGNRVAGFSLHAPAIEASMHLEHCFSEGDMEGCVANGGNMVMHGVVVRASLHCGIHIYSRASAQMHDCAANACKGGGVLMHDSGTALTMHGGSLQNNEGPGICVTGRGAAELYKVATGGNSVCGYKVKHAGSAVALHECSSSKDRMAYLCGAGAELKCDDKCVPGMVVGSAPPRLMQRVKSMILTR